MMARQKRETSKKKKKLAPLPVPQHTIGAGNELGISVMLDNQIEKYFLTSGSFVGSKVIWFTGILWGIPIHGFTAFLKGVN